MADHWADKHVSKPMVYADKSDAEIAGMVRMLMRGDLMHEAICVAARDRIAKLSKLNYELARTCGCLEPGENGRPSCDPPCIACQGIASGEPRPVDTVSQTTDLDLYVYGQPTSNDGRTHR